MRGVRSQHRAELECGESPRSEGHVVARARGARWREGREVATAGVCLELAA